MNNTRPVNLQDKKAWCEHGANLEQEFCAKIAPEFGLYAAINPEKAHNVYAPDLVVRADLKTKTVPFFTAGKYGYDPQYTVTLNQKDVDRYSRLYPDLLILYYVDWQVLQWRDIQVKPMRGVWMASMQLTKRLVENAPLHHYQDRVDDTQGNAKSSYLLDLRRFLCYAIDLCK